MQFLPDPGSPATKPPRDARIWQLALFASAAATVFATRWPWIRVKFERLFGSYSGPPAWQSTVGFTCLCTSLMVAVMALAESGTPTSRQAVRPGSLLLACVALLTLTASALQGPGNLRSVSAAWTPWFYVASASLPLLFAACLQRWRNHRWPR
jgi:hypothetical protein